MARMPKHRSFVEFVLAQVLVKQGGNFGRQRCEQQIALGSPIARRQGGQNTDVTRPGYVIELDIIPAARKIRALQKGIDALPVGIEKKEAVARPDVMLLEVEKERGFARAAAPVRIEPG